MVYACADPESFVRGVNVSLAGRWWPANKKFKLDPSDKTNTECWLVSFVILQGIRTNNAKKPYIFMIGSGPPVSPSVSAHVYLFIHLSAIAFEN